MDLFETPEKLPQEVQNILLEEEEIENYVQCTTLQVKLKPHGYTFDFGLDAVPYNLRKL